MVLSLHALHFGLILKLYIGFFDVVASPEEFGYVIVREAFEPFGCGFVEKAYVTDKDDLKLAVDQQEQVINELEAQLKELKRHICDTPTTILNNYFLIKRYGINNFFFP